MVGFLKFMLKLAKQLSHISWAPQHSIVIFQYHLASIFHFCVLYLNWHFWAPEHCITKG